MAGTSLDTQADQCWPAAGGVWMCDPDSLPWILVSLTQSPGAEDLHALRELERQMDVEPDWNVNAYMRSETVENRKRSVLTTFVVRMLGLGICPDTEVGPGVLGLGPVSQDP